MAVTRTALVVGAGIGGLSAAIFLRKAGWKVRVFERAASVRELGFGLGMAPTPSRRSAGWASPMRFWHAASVRRAGTDLTRAA